MIFVTTTQMQMKSMDVDISQILELPVKFLYFLYLQELLRHATEDCLSNINIKDLSITEITRGLRTTFHEVQHGHSTAHLSVLIRNMCNIDKRDEFNADFLCQALAVNHYVECFRHDPCQKRQGSLNIET